MKLYPQEHYPPGLELTVHDCLTTLRKVFVDAMEDAIEKHMVFLHKINGVRVTMVEDTDTGSSLSGGLRESKSRPNDGEDASVSDGDDENGNENDLGTDTEKRKRQENDEMEYNDNIGKEEGMDSESEEEIKYELENEDDPVDSGGESEVTEEGHVSYSNKIAEETAKSICVKECKNISRCTVVEEGRLHLQTAGVNFEAFWNLEDYLDIRKVKSNDIHAMLKTYGVEAARATILQEVRGVFRSYGIYVNMRHLCMIADFITFDGGYRPMSRLGMGQLCTSPFGKMTFETTTKFIVEAAPRGESHTFDCPSASVSLGKPSKMETGCFGLLHNMDWRVPW